MGTTSTLKPAGSRAYIDDYKTVFVMGAYGLGAVYETLEVVTAGFNPGMTVDPLTTVGLEEQCTIGADASVVAIGIAEVDFGIMASCAIAYVATDQAKVIRPHWNPGALLRNIMRVAAGADTHPGDYWGTTSGTAGKIDQDLTTGVMIRGQDFATAATTTNMVGWFNTGSGDGV